MTDKQIIYNCPHISFTDWGTYACKLYDPRDKNCLVKGGNCDSNISCPYKQLKQAEQRIVELNKTIQAKEQECEAYKIESDEGKEINAELKAENEKLKEILNKGCLHNLTLITEKRVLLQTITEIKEVLQFYNNTTIGVDKGNGIFEFEVSNDNIGKLIYCYDTNPAKIALQKISECEV